jgi:hypothetical protein
VFSPKRNLYFMSDTSDFVGYGNNQAGSNPAPFPSPQPASVSGEIDTEVNSGAFAGVTAAAGGSQGPVTTLPWSTATSDFFPPRVIDQTRWDKIYPYRLLVINVEEGNTVVTSFNAAPQTDQASRARPGGTVPVRVQIDSSAITINPVNTWEFRLPLTPEQISVTDQYAISTSATFRGILEEHGGVKFKMISAQGSTGVFPTRTTTKTPANASGALGFLQKTGLASNTLSAFGTLSSQVSSTINIMTGKLPYSAPPIPAVPLDQTGYYQAQLLEQFIEQYVQAKTHPKCKGWRLVWDDMKSNASYIVTPVTFSLTKNAQRPGLHMYAFQLKAWKRINLNTKTKTVPSNITKLSITTMQSILNSLAAARLAVQESFALLSAVQADITAPLTILRQATLLVTDLAGLVQTAAALPNKLVLDYKSAISQDVSLLQGIFTSSSSATVQVQVAAIIAAAAAAEGLTVAQVQSGNLGTQAAKLSANSTALTVFNQPATSYELLSQIPLTSLVLTDAQQAAFAAEVATVQQKTIAQLQQERLVFRNFALDASNLFGAGNALVNTLYGRGAPATSPYPMTVEQSEIIERLWDVIQALDTLTASNFLDASRSLNPMQYVGVIAAANGIAFDSTSPSKVAVPIPFGLSIEQIADRYLGDASRYVEIVTLNKLRDPYIDEVGFTTPLLSNGDNRFVTVSSNTNLYIGQVVTLSSTTTAPFTRNILNIEQLDTSLYLITLDGLADLDDLMTANNATLQAYLPGTLNSQNLIYIPSELASTPDNGIAPPSLIADTSLIGLSQVDILLTDQMDIAINALGDFRYSAGVTNLIQALKIKFSTELGTVFVHPEFGLELTVGASIADVDFQLLYNQINTMVIRDPRFSGVTRLQISFMNGFLNISMDVSLAQQNGIVPITFALDTRTLAA